MPHVILENNMENNMNLHSLFELPFNGKLPICRNDTDHYEGLGNKKKSRFGTSISKCTRVVVQIDYYYLIKG